MIPTAQKNSRKVYRITSDIRRTALHLADSYALLGEDGEKDLRMLADYIVELATVTRPSLQARTIE